MIEIAIAVLFGLVVITLYNRLVGMKNGVEQAFSDIDTLLKKRFDLIPNLVATAQQFMQHERELLSRVTELRSLAMRPDVTPAQTMDLDRQLSPLLGNILVAMENYPDLKANDNMMHLQRTLSEIESQIASARFQYNQIVTEYNNMIEMIPTNFVAMLMRYERRALFEIPQGEQQNVNVAELFGKK